VWPSRMGIAEPALAKVWAGFAFGLFGLQMPVKKSSNERSDFSIFLISRVSLP
jgi:hypothetical protein